MSAAAEILGEARVLVCLGPGGVGKTTTAAALAYAAAADGRRVAVLTVDPAARLKDALGLPDEPGALHPIPLPRGAAGSLVAGVLDAKGLFDELVRRLAPSPSVAERVLANPVYRNVAGAFAGSDAYMALERVLDVVDGGRFDLVVVDTPPAAHALDLFDAPARVLALLDSPALDYLGEPIRILGGATSRLARGLLAAVLAGLERLTGLSLLADVSALARDFALVSPAFRQRAEAISALLRSPATRFLLIAAPDPHGAQDLVAFAGELAQAGVRCDGLVLNRVLSLDASLPRLPAVDPGRAEGAALTWPPSLSRKLVRCLHELEAHAEAQRRVTAELRRGLEERGLLPERWIELPQLSPAPTSAEGIQRLAASLRSGAEAPDDAAARRSQRLG